MSVKVRGWLYAVGIALLCMVGLFTFKNVQAAPSDTSIYLGGASYHIGKDTYTYKGETRPLNEQNYMLGLQYKQFMMFGMKNSYHRTSIGVVWTPEHEVTNWFAVGIRLGLTTGYGDTPVDLIVAPVVNPYMDFSYDLYHVQFGFLPSGTGDCDGILTLNLKYDIPL